MLMMMVSWTTTSPHVLLTVDVCHACRLGTRATHNFIDDCRLKRKRSIFVDAADIRSVLVWQRYLGLCSLNSDSVPRRDAT